MDKLLPTFRLLVLALVIGLSSCAGRQARKGVELDRDQAEYTFRPGQKAWYSASVLSAGRSKVSIQSSDTTVFKLVKTRLEYDSSRRPRRPRGGSATWNSQFQAIGAGTAELLIQHYTLNTLMSEDTLRIKVE